ncbi:MAG: DUF262 domain-containing protein [Verrucomicrobiales bacterium]|nr:DUF262 domain-containing protein [Verrucomicrobiales bacterium]MBP9223522.1 DUF262 domain-containing protein [Verrucomicrobiales bacterium]
MPTVTPTYKTVQDLLKDEKFSIDDYQREYKWEKKQIEELINDLTSKFFGDYKPEHETKDVSSYDSYFLGSIIVSLRGGVNFLIDGQQRTTSLTLLLIYLYHRLSAINSNAKAKLESLIFSDDYGAYSFNLKIADRRPVLEALFEGKPFNTDDQEESLVNMVNRYRDIAAELDADPEEPDLMDAAIEHFTYWLMGKVGLIVIATDDDAYAYTIFETMNDRGKPLSPTDMLKAYLLGRIKDTEVRSAANEKWKAEIQDLMHYGRGKDDDIESNFLKTWLRAQYARETRQRKANAKEEDWEKIHVAFHRWVNDQRAVIGLHKEEDFVRLIREEIPFFARVYRKILDASQNLTQGLEAVFYNASNDLTLQTTVLMAAVKLGDSEEVINRKLQIVATYLDHFLVRRVVNYIRVGYSAIQYTMVQIMKEVRHKSPEELITVLSQRLAKDDATLDSAKGGNRKGISDFRINMFTKRYVHYILARMTAYAESSCDKGQHFAAYVNRIPTVTKNPYEVEHLWPNHYEDFANVFQTEDEFSNWRNHLGGLVLLPKSKNASLNDKPYPYKREHYQDENLLAASLGGLPYAHLPRFKTFREASGHDFKSYPAFGKEEQMERRALYEGMMKHLWSIDRLKEL